MRCVQTWQTQVTDKPVLEVVKDPPEPPLGRAPFAEHRCVLEPEHVGSHRCGCGQRLGYVRLESE